MVWRRGKEGSQEGNGKKTGYRGKCGILGGGQRMDYTAGARYSAGKLSGHPLHYVGPSTVPDFHHEPCPIILLYFTSQRASMSHVVTHAASLQIRAEAAHSSPDHSYCWRYRPWDSSLLQQFGNSSSPRRLNCRCAAGIVGTPMDRLPTEESLRYDRCAVVAVTTRQRSMCGVC